MRLLDMKQLKTVKGVPFSKTSLHRLMNADEFPRPIKIGANRVAWLESEIDAWIAERSKARDAA